MSIDYTLNWSDNLNKNSILVVGESVDTTTTSLSLTGKGAVNWGEYLQENLLHLLENFASNGTPPHNPTLGQTWYDATTNELKVYSVGSAWTVVWPQENQFNPIIAISSPLQQGLSRSITITQGVPGMHFEIQLFLTATGGTLGNGVRARYSLDSTPVFDGSGNYFISSVGLEIDVSIWGAGPWNIDWTIVFANGQVRNATGIYLVSPFPSATPAPTPTSTPAPTATAGITVTPTPTTSPSAAAPTGTVTPTPTPTPSLVYNPTVVMSSPRIQGTRETATITHGRPNATFTQTMYISSTSHPTNPGVIVNRPPASGGTGVLDSNGEYHHDTSTYGDGGDISTGILPTIYGLGPWNLMDVFAFSDGVSVSVNTVQEIYPTIWMGSLELGKNNRVTGGTDYLAITGGDALGSFSVSIWIAGSGMTAPGVLVAVNSPMSFDANGAYYLGGPGGTYGVGAPNLGITLGGIYGSAPWTITYRYSFTGGAIETVTVTQAS